MAISCYKQNGEVLWKVYVHVRGTTNKKRFQKKVLGIKSKAEAIRIEKKLIKELSQQAQKSDGKGLFWEDIVHLWWEEVKLGYVGKITLRSAEGYMSIINKWTKNWNNMIASEITKVDARNLLIKLQREGLSKAYQKKVKNMINKVYEWGILFGHIYGVQHSPMKGLVIEIDEETIPEILTLEEIKRLLAAAKTVDHHWYSIWSFAVLTGMRSGELHALKWDKIDLEKNIIYVHRSYDSNNKEVGPTKGRYWRTVPINDSLRSLVIDLSSKRIDNHGDHVLPRSKDWDNGDQAVPLKNFLKSIKMKKIKFHTLRACFATQMLANGVPAAVVMKIGGWKKYATMEIYMRLAGIETKGATDCLTFVPNDIDFGPKVVQLSARRRINERN